MFRSRGFSLVEVMVAVIVISVGLLGIAKMQGLALSNTNTARLRSMAAIQAASLASAMHSNRQYWANNITTVTLGGGALASTEATLQASGITNIPAAVTQCLGITCTAPLLAAFDLARWAQSVTGLLPNAVATIGCPGIAGPNLPPSCTIQISWSEGAVAINQQEAGVLALPTYTLYVEP